jgi:hypothetical protein
MTVPYRVAVFALLIVAALGTLAPAAAQENLVAPEKNPPGDIPDNQVFVTYTSPDGFSLNGFFPAQRALSPALPPATAIPPLYSYNAP